jgi:hypothetical protein
MFMKLDLPAVSLLYTSLLLHAVSASEAGQQKRLLLLDNDWQQVGEVPLDVGRRFFTFAAPGTNNITNSKDNSIAGADGSSSESDSAAAAGVTSDASDTSDITDSGEVDFSAASPGGLVSLSPEVVQGLIRQGQLRRGDVVLLRAAEENEELHAAQQLLKKHGKLSGCL